MSALPAADDRPIGEVNTTPLIDVMLVLLIMFIITIPIQTHSVPLDLPGGPPDTVIDRDRNKLVVTEGGNLLWNGRAIGLTELRGTLGRLSAMSPQPELHFEPAPAARYERIGEVLALIKRANVSTLGFVGNERYAQF